MSFFKAKFATERFERPMCSFVTAFNKVSDGSKIQTELKTSDDRVRVINIAPDVVDAIAKFDAENGGREIYDFSTPKSVAELNRRFTPKPR